MQIHNGEELASLYKKTREEKKIKLETVNQLTRMNTIYLQAIESGKFKDLPDGYVRIFLKSYADFLELNFKEISQKYLDVTTDVTIDPSSIKENLPDDLNEIESSERINNFIISVKNLITKYRQYFLWFPLLIVFIIFYFLLKNFINKSNNQETKELTVNESLAKIDTTTIDTSKIIKTILSDSLKLEITVLQPLFFVVKIDTGRVEKINARQSKTYMFKAKSQFNIYASDGSKIELIFNDKNLGVPTPEKMKINFLVIEKNGIKAKGFAAIDDELKIKPKKISVDTISN